MNIPERSAESIRVMPILQIPLLHYLRAFSSSSFFALHQQQRVGWHAGRAGNVHGRRFVGGKRCGIDTTVRVPLCVCLPGVEGAPFTRRSSNVANLRSCHCQIGNWPHIAQSKVTKGHIQMPNVPQRNAAQCMPRVEICECHVNLAWQRTV